MSDVFFTLEHIARVLQVSYLTVYRWVRAGKLPASKVGRQYRVSQSDFATFLDTDKPRSIGAVSEALSRFIGSGMMDYSYIESQHYPIDLSLGINPFGTPFDVRKFLSRQRNLHYSDYPSVNGVELRQKLAEYHQLRPENILVGAGASELLHVVFLTYLDPGNRVVMPELTFPAFEMIALLVHAHAVMVPMTKSLDVDYEAISRQIDRETKLVALCNPNNPTGIGVSTDALIDLLKEHRDAVFLIDEANIDFGGESVLDAVKQFSNLIIARSFSKGFGLAGLRVGYLVADADVIYALQRRQTPFMTNAVGQVVAAKALDYPDFPNKTRAFCQEQRQWLAEALSQLGCYVVPSNANYLLVNVGKRGQTASRVLFKLHKLGATAINGQDFRGLDDRYLRLSPRDAQTNRQFIECLKQVFAE